MRDLVEQRLKGMVVAAVDQGHIHRHIGQRLRSAQAGETTADHDHPRARRQVLDRGRG